jgi:hypothetical protein
MRKNEDADHQSTPPPWLQVLHDTALAMRISTPPGGPPEHLALAPSWVEIKLQQCAACKAASRAPTFYCSAECPSIKLSAARKGLSTWRPELRFASYPLRIPASLDHHSITVEDLN